MAIKGNAVTEESAGSQYKLYTGVAAFRVVAINPDQEGLKKLGFKAEKAPVYMEDKDGIRNVRIIAHIEATAPGGTKIKTHIPIFLRNKLMTDVWINKFGRFGKDRTKLAGELRNPYEGEVDLLGFIADWCNVSMKKGAEEELFLDSIQKIVSTGDIFELREVFKANQANIFKAFCLVSEGKYQRVYTKRFVRGWNSDYSFLHKSMAENQKYIKEDHGGVDFSVYIPEQFELKEWSRSGYVPATATAGTATMQSSQAAAPDDDETPF